VLYEALSGLQPFLADSAEDMLTIIGKKMAARLEPAEAARQAAAQQHYHQHHHQQHRSSSTWDPQQAADLPAFIARLQLSPDAKDFLASCLTWDPSRRPSTAQLLSHPWLQRMQDEAAAVAASRANSRRMSMQISMQRARLSSDDSAAGTGAGAGAVEQQQQHVSLVDPVMAGMLEDSSAAGDHMHHHHEGYERHNSLDLMASALERSQTSEQLEVGARNVLRSRTQRLDTRPMHARVHAA
jgi:serine/threonine protein kinase